MVQPPAGRQNPELVGASGTGREPSRSRLSTALRPGRRRRPGSRRSPGRRSPRRPGSKDSWTRPRARARPAHRTRTAATEAQIPDGRGGVAVGLKTDRQRPQVQRRAAPRRGRGERRVDERSRRGGDLGDGAGRGQPGPRRQRRAGRPRRRRPPPARRTPAPSTSRSCAASVVSALPSSRTDSPSPISSAVAKSEVNSAMSWPLKIRRPDVVREHEIRNPRVGNRGRDPERQAHETSAIEVLDGQCGDRYREPAR